MSRQPVAIAHLGELMSMIDRHATPQERPDHRDPEKTITVRVPEPLERWKASKVAKFKRLEKRLNKLKVGSA